MDIHELKNVLKGIDIPERLYSLNGSIGSNKFVLQHVHSFWEYFYIDERGGENGYRKFASEEDACVYFLEKMKNEEQYYKRSKK